MNTITTECPECGSDDYRQLTTDTGHNQCNECRQEWWRDVDYTKPLTHGGNG